MNKAINKFIPVLRFPEFANEDEWDNEVLGQLSEIVRGGSPRPIQDYITTHKNGLNWLKIADVPSDSKYIKETKERVKKEALSSTREVNAGDLILSNSMSFGRPYILKITTCIHDGWIAVRKISNKTFEDYLYYFISSESSQSYFQANAAGAAVKNLNAEIIKLLPIYLPKNKKEQQKLASCLSSLDEVIEAHGKKLDTLIEHKKGLMQNLFPKSGESMPKWRFKEFEKDGNWMEEAIENYIDLFSGIALKSEELSDDESGVPILRGINITEGYIRHSKEIDKYFTGNIENLKKYLIRENDIVIGMDGSKVGKNVALIKKSDENAILIQRVARIRANEKLDINYVYQQFLSDKFIGYVDTVNTSSGIPHISAQQIKNFKIGFPPKKKEQNKIADCLASLDALISAQTEMLEQLKLHKKGLMQGLFPKIND